MNNFIKIYFWQIISIALNFGSLFIVTPYLSLQPSLFGIYSIITSLYIFLSYADLGFLTAGTKYASEYFIQNKRDMEIKTIGFVGFIYFVFVLLYAITVFFIAFNPQVLVKNFGSANELKAAKNLLFILSISSPAFVGQKVLQLIFGIRLEDFRFQRILSMFNLLKITSVWVFFSSNKYEIVNYFMFCQICNCLAVVVGGIVAKKRLNYDLKLLMRSFRFDNEMYVKTSKLAYASLYLTLCWILYYEIDLFVLGKIGGPKLVAVFAIGISVTTIFRTLYGVIFAPFTVKFNHFVGMKNNDGIKTFFTNVLVISLPLTVFPALAVTITMKSFIYSWVGPMYATSVKISQFLLLSYIFSFISYPSSLLLLAYEKIRGLIITSSILPIVYWGGILLTFGYWGIMSFAYLKFTAFVISATVDFAIVLSIFKMKFFNILKVIVIPSILPCVVLIIGLLMMQKYMPFEKSKVSLFMFALINGASICFAMGIYYVSSREFRKNVNNILNNIKLRAR